MPSNTENVKLGVCSVIYDGVDLGYTQGGVEVTVATTTKKVMVDQFGQSEINEYIIGRTCMAKVPLAETTFDNLVKIMPGAVLKTSGTGPDIKKAVVVPNGVGISLLSRAKSLVLHPIANDVDDTQDDFIMPLASTPGAMQFSFKLDQERLFPVEFNAYPDPVTKTLFIVGDEETGSV